MSVHLAKGARDFLPEAMNRRQRVIGIVTDVFERFGFEQLQTPAFERLETLTGKYGDEGEGLMFKILKRGEAGKRGEADLALRYDLTVPLARVMAMNQGLRLPFKRYQVQPVWRADRPQRGRFREFYQCDVDIVGCETMAADAECLAVAEAGLTALGFEGFTIRLNHRGILSAITRVAGVAELETSVLVAVDKLDKIGREGVDKELRERGVPVAAIERLWALWDVPMGEQLDHLDRELDHAGRAAVAELREVLTYAEAMGVEPYHVAVDTTLARGLSYYTGPVFEATLDGAGLGSVAGGGRYDGLVGMFSGRDVPAVGVSLGLERLITVLDERGKLDDVSSSSTVLVTVFSDETRAASFCFATHLRRAGVPCRVSLKARGKLGKQFKAAQAWRIPWVATLGPDEIAGSQVTLKRLATSEQVTVSWDEAVRRLGR